MINYTFNSKVVNRFSQYLRIYAQRCLKSYFDFNRQQHGYLIFQESATVVS